jgi:lipopolysaccharide transport system permease protein
MTWPSARAPHLILEAGRADSQYWGDVWRYRELFFILAWRDVAVRQANSHWCRLGGGAALPATMVVFTLIFSHLANCRVMATRRTRCCVRRHVALVSFLFRSQRASGIVSNANLISKSISADRHALATMEVALADFD